MDETLATILADVLSGEQNFFNLVQEKKKDIVQFALVEGVSSVLYHHCKQNNINDESVPLYEVLRERTQLQYITYLTRMVALQEAVKVFEKESISFIFFKGFSVAHQVYDRPHLRMMSDVDVMVHQQDRKKGIELLQKLGFRMAPLKLGYDNPLTWKYGHVYELYKKYVDIDLHDKVYDTRGILQLSDEQNEWLMTQHKRVKLDCGLDILVLRPEIEILYTGVHTLMHHINIPSFRNILDVYFICNSSGFSWEFSLMAAEKLGWSESYYIMLMCTKRIFQLEIPDTVWKSLEEKFGSETIENYIARIRKEFNFWHAFRSVEKKDRFRYFFRLYIFPTKRYIKNTYPVQKFYQYPYYYLLFMIERIKVFLRVRFGINFRKTGEQ